MSNHQNSSKELRSCGASCIGDALPIVFIDGNTEVIDTNACAREYGVRVGETLTMCDWTPRAGGQSIGEVLFSHERVFRIELACYSALPYRLVLSDITETYTCLSEMVSTLENAELEATTDFVTGIYNGRCFRTLLSKEIEKRQRTRSPLGIAYLDLNDFKIVNDKWGHTAGDQVLQIIANVLTETIRSTDTAARIGGDEFAVLFPDTDHAGVRSVMTRILEGVKAKMADVESPVTVSCGAVVFVSQPESVDSVFRMVDKLMYAAKKKQKESKLQQEDSSSLATGVC